MTEPPPDHSAPTAPAPASPPALCRLGFSDSRRLLRKGVGGLWLGAWFFGALLCGLLVSFAWERWSVADAMPRGVAVAGQELGQLPEGAVRQALSALADRAAARPVELRTPAGRVLSVPARALGLGLDLEATLEALRTTGREAGGLLDFPAWLSSLVRTQEVAPLWQLDEERLAERAQEELLRELRAPLLPSLRFDGELLVERGHGGTVLEFRQLARRVREQAPRLLTEGSGIVLEFPVVERQQAISDAEFEAALARAERLLAQPLRFVVVADEAAAGEESSPLSLGALTLRPSRWGGALRTAVTEPAGDEPARFTTGFDVEVLRQALRPLLEDNEVLAESARFEPKPSGQVELLPARVGRRLDTELLSERMWAAAEGEREVQLPWTVAHPELSTERAEALGIKKVVHSFATRHACCQPRVQNIHTAAVRLDGVVIEPGQSFSLNDRLGPRTPAAGYRAAPTIVRGEMKEMHGGGISQLATTLFNAVLRGGYEIVQRQPHSLYFSRYPEGHEATVSYPQPDLIFRNDTQAGMVLRIQTTPTMIRVLVLGDDEGRRVSVHKSPRTDLVQPPVEYEADDSMDPEEQKRLRAGQLGWKVVVSRVVTYADGRKKEEKREVTYQPRPELLRVHSCKIPQGADGHTGEECPEPEREEREEVLSEDTYYETVDWEMDEGG